MEEEPPIRITVYDKAYARRGYITSPLAVNIMAAWNAPGLTTFSVDASHSRVNDLAAEGSRCVVEYRPPGRNWMTIMSGLVSGKSGSGGPENRVREYTVLDDLDVLNDLCSYPVPGSPASSQSGSAYDINTGPFETIYKTLVSDNVAGRSYPKLTVQASAGLGATATTRHRMHNIGERMLTSGIRYGIGWRVVQTGTTRQLQAWQPASYTRVLTEESGAVQSVEFTSKPPDVTRVIVGIGEATENVKTSRQFYDAASGAGFADTTAEALWGVRRELFIDAGDIETSDANKASLALARATEALEEGAAKVSLKAELSETGFFQFGVAFNLGDLVKVQPSGAPVFTERVREVEIEWDAENGLTVTPRVGEWAEGEGTDARDRIIRKALRRINDLGTR